MPQSAGYQPLEVFCHQYPNHRVALGYALDGQRDHFDHRGSGDQCGLGDRAVLDVRHQRGHYHHFRDNPRSCGHHRSVESPRRRARRRKSVNRPAFSVRLDFPRHHLKAAGHGNYRRNYRRNRLGVWANRPSVGSSV